MKAGERWGRGGAIAVAGACALGVVSCGPGTGSGRWPEGGEAPRTEGPLRVREAPERPRFAALVREGDPVPALGAVVFTGAGSGATVALGAVMEERLRGAGVPTHVAADRDSLRLHIDLPGAPGAAASAASLWLAALVTAFAAPIHAGPELRVAGERLTALTRHPLPSRALDPILACTGELGVAPGDRLPDLGSDAGLGALTRAAEAAFRAENIALAVVGPGPVCDAVAAEADRTSGWRHGGAARALPAWPASDEANVFAAHGAGHRLEVAVRTPDPAAAAAAARVLGAPGSLLRTRLEAQSPSFSVKHVSGIARPDGGCVAVSIESATASGNRDESIVGVAAAIAETAMAAALAQAPKGADTTAILSAHDPADAAVRAAWWTLAAPAAGATTRWIAVWGAPESERWDPAVGGPAFQAAWSAARAASAQTVVERRARAELGQGEAWILLASPCAPSDEGPLDAGASALAALVATRNRPTTSNVSVSPWIQADGVGVIAHAAAEPGEDPRTLARRVADAAGAVIAGRIEALPTDLRLSGQHRLEAALVPAVVWDAIALKFAPMHPAALHPFGLWGRLSAIDLGLVRAAWRRVADGPLRMAILANADAQQADEAFAAADRWFAPRVRAASACAVPETERLAAPAAETKSVEVPSELGLTWGAWAVHVSATSDPGAETATWSARLLDGERGVVQRALDSASVPARGGAHLFGGRRGRVLVLDVAAPADVLPSALATLKAATKRIGDGGVSASDLEAIREGRRGELESAARSPLGRLEALWRGSSEPHTQPTPGEVQAFFASTFRDGAGVWIEGSRK